MPVKVIRYACVFRCGAKLFTSIQQAEMHEAVCTANPNSKSCRTCINQMYEKNELSAIRSCKIKKMAKFIEDVHHLLQRDMNYHVRPLYQCPNYNMATEVKGLDAYIKDLEEKFDEIQKKQEEAEAVIVKFKKPTH